MPPFLFVGDVADFYLIFEFRYLGSNFIEGLCHEDLTSKKGILRDLQNSERWRLKSSKFIVSLEFNAGNIQSPQLPEENVERKSPSIELVKIAVLADLRSFEDFKLGIFDVVKIDLRNLEA